MTMDTYGTMQGTCMQELGLNNEDTFYSQYHSFLSTVEDYVVEAKKIKAFGKTARAISGQVLL